MDSKNSPGENSGLTEARVEMPFSPKISRLFIFRWLWMIPEVIVIALWMLSIFQVMFRQLLYQFFTGRRSEKLWKRQVRFFSHLTKWNAYIMWLTDKRPKLIED